MKNSRQIERQLPRRAGSWPIAVAGVLLLGFLVLRLFPADKDTQTVTVTGELTETAEGFVLTPKDDPIGRFTIVNGADPTVRAQLQPLVGSEVTMTGLRLPAESRNLNVLRLNRETIATRPMPTVLAVPENRPSTFEVYLAAFTALERQCVQDKLGQASMAADLNLPLVSIDVETMKAANSCLAGRVTARAGQL